MAKLHHGLNLQKKGPSGLQKPAPVKRKTIFDDEESDAEETAKAPANGFEEISTFDEDAKPSTRKPNPLASGPPSRPTKAKAASTDQQISLSTLRTHNQRATEAEALDPGVYDYDAAYDALHAKTTAKKAAERADAQERRPKYMENLLAAAEVRKRDQLRAKDRLLQKEREAEGEKFADRDMFVTEAYKKQQEEVRRMEEEEAKREEEEAKKRRGKGMVGFYKSVIDEEEKKHQETVKAAEAVKSGAEAVVGEQDEEKSAAELAKELNAKGANIVLNEEGLVADKRQLLTSGLNVAPKRKADGTTVPGAAAAQRPVQKPGYRGATDSQKAMRERQTRMMEAQLEQAAKRAAEEEAEERAKVERAAKSRKTDGDISSAKERYLQRKREAAEAAANKQ